MEEGGMEGGICCLLLLLLCEKWGTERTYLLLLL